MNSKWRILLLLISFFALTTGCRHYEEDIVTFEFMGIQYEASEQEERIITRLRDEKEMNFILYPSYESNAFEYNREDIFEMIANVVREETDYTEFIFSGGFREASDYLDEGVVVIYPVVWGSGVTEILNVMSADAETLADNIIAAAFLQNFDYQLILIHLGEANPLIIPSPTMYTFQRIEAINIYFMIETAGLDVITVLDEGLDIFLGSDFDYNVDLPGALDFPIDFYDVLEVEALKDLWFTEFRITDDIIDITLIIRSLNRLNDE